MKKTIVIATLLLIGLSFNVIAGETPSCYVKTADKTYFGEKVKTGIMNFKITADDGSVVKVPVNKVKSYTDGSKYYELLPAVNEEYGTLGNEFMEYVTSKNGLRLFSVNNPNLEKPGREFYVFKNECLYLKLNVKNASTVLAFFGIAAR